MSGMYELLMKTFLYVIWPYFIHWKNRFFDSGSLKKNSIGRWRSGGLRKSLKKLKFENPLTSSPNIIFSKKVLEKHLVYPFLTLDRLQNRFFNDFWIFSKKCCKNPYYFVSRIFSTPLRTVQKIVSGSENESKPSLESFQVTKVDHISLFNHNFWMKTR